MNIILAVAAFVIVVVVACLSRWGDIPKYAVPFKTNTITKTTLEE